MSLDRHINLGWQGYLCRELGEFIDVVPPQQRIDEHWYQGTADAVYQNIYTIEKERPAYVVILAGDHIYKMDYLKLVERHIETQADLTVGALAGRRPRRRSQFGVMRGRRRQPRARVRGEAGRSRSRSPAIRTTPWPRWAFTSSPPASSSSNSASTPRGTAASTISAATSIPSVIDTHRVFAYPFLDENRKKDAYWRDVGTLDAYYEANMDLISVDPLLESVRPALADPHLSAELCRRRSSSSPSGARRPAAARPWTASSARARSSPAGRWSARSSGPTCRINSYSQVEDSILFDGVNIGRHAKVRRAIIDKEVEIPPGIEIGFDHDLDRSRGFLDHRQRRDGDCQDARDGPHRGARAVERRAPIG